MFCAFLSVFLLPDKVTESKKPVVKREQMRYDGKSFVEWQRILQTELKPQRQTEALRAMRMFASKGYAADACKVVIDFMDNNHEDVVDGEDWSTLQREAHLVLDVADTGARPAIDAVLRGTSKRQKLFILDTLRFGHLSQYSVSALSKASMDKDVEISNAAIRFLVGHQGEKGVVDVLNGLLKEGTVAQRLRTIKQLNTLASGSVDVLLSALSDQPSQVRMAAISSLGTLLLKDRIPEVSKRLTLLLEDRSHQIRLRSLCTLHRLGTKPENSSAIVREVVRTGDVDERIAAVGVLKYLHALCETTRDRIELELLVLKLWESAGGSTKLREAIVAEFPEIHSLSAGRGSGAE